jgi:hypothetical protein
MRLSGKQSGDPSIFLVGTFVTSSDSPLTGNGGFVQRWGDYSAVSYDYWTDTFFLVNELSIQDGVFGSAYGTQFARAGIP